MEEAVGNHEAVERVVRDHAGWVFAAAKRRVKDATLAEDVTQAVFVLYWRKGVEITHEGKRVGWLYRAVRYCSANALRLRNMRERHEREAAMESQRDGRSAGWSDVEVELEGAMDRLSEQDRRALVLRFYRSLSLKEVGEAMGVSEEAARKRVERAVGKLRERLQATGVSTTPASLSALALANLPTNAPEHLVAGMCSALRTAAWPSKIVTIAEEARNAMRWHRIRLTVPAAAVVVLGIVIWAAEGTPLSTANQPAPLAARPPATSRATQADPVTLASLRAPDLVDLVLATRGRYTSFEVVTRSLAYNKSAITATDKPYLLKNMLWRMSGSRQYFRRETRQVPEGGDVESAPARIFEDSADPELVKHLESAGIIPMPRARIERPVRPFHPDASLVYAVWGNFGWGWDKLRDEATSISYDPVTGQFRMERQPPGAARIAATIDAAKGFVPTKFEIYGKDGTLVLCVENSDFRQVGEGLWLPYHSVETNYNAQNPTCVVRDVLDLKVNAPIPDAQLGVVFPDGADVEDRTMGTRYGGGTEFGRPVTMTRPSRNTKSPNANGSLYSKDNVLYASDMQEPGIPYVILQCTREDARPFQVVSILRKGEVQLGKLTVSCPSEAIQISHAGMENERLMRLKISARPNPSGEPLKTEVLVQGVEPEDILKIPVIVVTAPPIEVAPAFVAVGTGQSACRVRVGGWATEKHAPVLERWELADGTLPVSDCKLAGNGREVEIILQAVPRNGGFARSRVTLHLKAGDSRVAVPVTLLVPPGGIVR